MSELHGEIHASNRGRTKDGSGRGTGRGMPHLIKYTTLIIPNYKAKHRSKGDGIVWRYELHYIQNRYYAEYRPRIRRILKAMKLRK
jgi:hypothetical protein